MKSWLAVQFCAIGFIDSALNRSSIIYHSADCVRRAVIVAGNLYASLRRAGVDNLAAADIKSHVIDFAASGVEYEVAGLDVRHADLGTRGGLRNGAARQANAEIAKDAVNKA